MITVPSISYKNEIEAEIKSSQDAHLSNVKESQRGEIKSPNDY